MLKTEILNAPLLAGLATLGHTDTVIIADYGLPLPTGTPVVDLAFVRGQLSFPAVLEVLARHLVIERSLLASEARGTTVEGWCHAVGLTPGFISHEQLKAEIPRAKLVIRTGEATAYANVILGSGVPF
ncbi:D-ribose pyranase [Glutamicibacter sp. PS]|uniref:D-ribose pyranase n=1 Tax=Glutamicibacter sp. PS TaxID=3075634 RepID=UPI002844862A|nr:D-ribose pyranase [Glutamicibacter sp. PS]MDR4533611.1 D-ribose pyranase [Glutamicibacter sp. PS]